jgi:hypothetical protein
VRLGTAGAIGVMGDRMAFSCRNCGKPQNRPGLKFCPDCGQPISGAVLPDSYRGTTPSDPPGRRRFGLLAALMVTAIAVAGGAGALTGLLRSPPGPARLSAQTAPAPGLGTPPGTRPAGAGASTPPPDAASPAPASPAPASPAPASPAPVSPAPVSTGPSEADELQQLAAVVRQSSAARRITVNATGGVGNCTVGTGAGIAMMNQSIRTRQAALSEVSSLSGEAVPGGPALISDLVQAMNYSISADHHFITWMRHAGSAGTCPAPQNGDPAWDAGIRLSGLAMTQKSRFVTGWNPLATQFGLRTYTAYDV